MKRGQEQRDIHPGHAERLYESRTKGEEKIDSDLLFVVIRDGEKWPLLYQMKKYFVEGQKKTADHRYENIINDLSILTGDSEILMSKAGDYTKNKLGQTLANIAIALPKDYPDRWVLKAIAQEMKAEYQFDSKSHAPQDQGRY